jgi:hypothetical protein
MVHTYTSQHTQTHSNLANAPPYIRRRFLYVYVLVCGSSGARYSTSALDAYMPLVPEEGSRNNIVPGPGGGDLSLFPEPGAQDMFYTVEVSANNIVPLPANSVVGHGPKLVPSTGARLPPRSL